MRQNNEVKGRQIHAALVEAAKMHTDGTDVGAFITDVLRDAAEACEVLGYPDTFERLEDRRDSVMDWQHHARGYTVR